jgi:DNA-binding response OmpR family regulator
VTRRGPKVLVVEDRDDLYDACSDALADAGFSVEGAADEQQALSSARRLKPDLILVDSRAPVGRHFTDDPELRDVLIVAMPVTTTRSSLAQLINAIKRQLASVPGVVLEPT